jgi:hypothetical protein
MTRHNRDWWDDSPAMRHAPAGGPDPFWRGFMLAFGVVLVIGFGVLAVVWAGGAA